MFVQTWHMGVSLCKYDTWEEVPSNMAQESKFDQIHESKFVQIVHKRVC